MTQEVENVLPFYMILTRRSMSKHITYQEKYTTNVRTLVVKRRYQMMLSVVVSQPKQNKYEIQRNIRQYAHGVNRIHSYCFNSIDIEVCFKFTKPVDDKKGNITELVLTFIFFSRLPKNPLVLSLSCCRARFEIFIVLTFSITYIFRSSSFL